MDKSNLFGKKRRTENIGESKRTISIKKYRTISIKKYWNLARHDYSGDVIGDFQKIKRLKHASINLPTAQLRRFYRKMTLISRLPSLGSSCTEDPELRNCDSSSIGLIQTIPLSMIPCSYTDRLLKPFIFQDFENQPLWLKMNEELIYKVTDVFPSCKRKNKKKKHPINYMYIQTEHIPAINSLAEIYFWPGIDVSSALWYPEFSCVALYKKLVVGFGIMAPGLYLNEAYIHFLFVRPHWRSSGIGSFILYHLTQTCLSWNISLNTSLSNDAVLLYNKFTFKVHKMIRDFYGGRIPLNSNKSGHAFSMQLQKCLID